ncbi:MAG: FprA family A-type flavoprotein [Bacilli bacterium]|nr:FprA family A-type flavoprotein [Bacilli bacterium]
MKAYEIKPDVYWVGAIDWNLRNFHGYDTSRGGTYNAYLILDEKITLIDNVYHSFTDELIERISSIIDPSKIEVIISNHGEPDHSGSLKKILALAPHAKVYASPNGEKILKAEYGNIPIQAVKSGETLSIGKRTLCFVHTPMVHWPDNMVTYDEYDQILFSNDAFGQHIASSARLDEDYSLEVLFFELKKYYANIILPYSSQTKKALEAINSLKIQMICPSHGLLIKKYLKEVLEVYQGLVEHRKKNQAIIIYDSMWGSTEKLAHTIAEAFISLQIPTSVYNVNHSHESDLILEMMEAKYVAIGSPTLNNGLLTSIAGFLNYIKGLKPQNLSYVAFGSYGWGGQSPNLIDQSLEEMGYHRLMAPIRQYFVPTKEVLEEFKVKLVEAIQQHN